tara:strand:- start:4 stop:207 length:204 start_codon:yes stop_codon:yes gene_type:complete
MTRKDWCVIYLKNKGVPLIEKTEYKNGQPVNRFYLANKLTKADQFYRINDVIVSRSMAAEASLVGLV